MERSYMEKVQRKITVALIGEHGLIELVFGEETYVLPPDVAMEVAKAIALCLREGQKASQNIPMVSFSGEDDLELSDLIKEETIA